MTVAPTTPPVTVAPTTPPARTEAPVAPQVAGTLSADVECVETPRPQPVARLRWTPAPGGGDAQRVDVTTRRDGFDTDVYRSSPVLPPDRTSFDWEAIEGQAVHYWRVATRHGTTWHASEVETFEGPVCAADFQPQQ